MQALKFIEPGTVRVVDVDLPKLPPGGLVVRTAFAGVCGSDVRTWKHGSPRLKGQQVLGHEASGTIVESDAPGLPVGTRVAVCPGMPCLRCEQCQRGGVAWCVNRESLGYDIPGAMAEFFALPALAVELGCVVPLPSSLSLRTASLAEPLHTVLSGQDRARIGHGQSVLVIGLGPIGTLHAAVARSRGAGPVLAVDRLPERTDAAAAILTEMGIGVALADEEAIRGAAPTHGWDTVIVAAGSAAAITAGIGHASPGGSVLAFGGLPPDRPLVDVDFNVVHYQQLTLVGAFGGSPRHFRQAVSWLAASPLDGATFITETRDLSHAAEAFVLVEQGVGLKTSISVSAEDDHKPNNHGR